MSVKSNGNAQHQQTQHRQRELHDCVGAQGITGHSLRICAPGPDSTLLQKAVVMTLQKKCFNLSHGVENHAYGDQHTSTAKEYGDSLRNVKLDQQEVRHDRNDRQEDRTGQGQSGHDKIQKLRSRLPWTNPRNVTTIFL